MKGLEQAGKFKIELVPVSKVEEVFQGLFG
jgi:hypothetical protein